MPAGLQKTRAPELLVHLEDMHIGFSGEKGNEPRRSARSKRFLMGTGPKMLQNADGGFSQMHFHGENQRRTI